MNILYFVETFLFWVTVSFDFVILFSIVFSLIYFIMLGLISFTSFRFQASFLNFGLPLLLVASISVFLSPIGKGLVFFLRDVWGDLLGDDSIRLALCILSILWFISIPVVLLRFLRQHFGLRSYYASLKDTNGGDIYTQALALCDVKRKVILKEGEDIASWCAYLILPKNFHTMYSSQEKLTLLVHELSHIKHRDTMKLFFICVIRSFFWFVPAVWQYVRLYRAQLEIRSDIETVHILHTTPDFYKALIFKATACTGGMALKFSDGYQPLKERLEFLNKTTPKRSIRHIVAMVLFILFLSLTTIYHNNFNYKPPFVSGQHFRVANLHIHMSFYWEGSLGNYAIIKPKSKVAFSTIHHSYPVQ